MRYVLALLFCLLIRLVFAQESSLLWEISGKGLKKPSFLYGTFHVQDQRVFQFGDSVMAKFKQCKVYAGELDMDKIGPFEAMKLMMMPKDTTLDMLLSKEDYQFVKKRAVEELGSMATVIDRIKPLFSSFLILGVNAQKEDAGVKIDSIDLDNYLQKLAKKRGMKVIGIETAEEQISAFDKLTLKEQAQMLLNSLKEESESDKFLEEMYVLYQNQDLEGIEKLVESSEMPDLFSESVLTQRNYVMAGRISKLVGKAPTFIGIGTAHLPGEEGVIELLRKKGFQVRPVISKYSGKTEEDLSVPSNLSSSGWSLYTCNEFTISFPSLPVIDTSKARGTISVYTLEPNTDNLYSVVYYPKTENHQNVDWFFEEVLQDYDKEGVKVIGNKKSVFQGVPFMEVEATQALAHFRIRYYFSDEKIIELTVTADKNEIRSGNSNLFFNSLKIIK